MDLLLDEELRDKIRRRSARAFEAFDNKPKPCALCGHTKNGGDPEKFHRITNLTEKNLRYRIKTGTSVTIRRDKRGRISVPKKVPLAD